MAKAVKKEMCLAPLARNLVTLNGNDKLLESVGFDLIPFLNVY